MDQYDAATYGDRIADVYDKSITVPRDTVDAVAFLLDVAGSGPVLELGIGTGRLALPLAEQRLKVRGIDSSRKMVARLRAKPGGRRIAVTIGDFADVRVEGRFTVVFVAANTFFALLSQKTQVRCFANVSKHLTPDGVFVIQAFVPDLRRFDRDQRIGTLDVNVDEVRFDASLHDPIEQQITSQHVVVAGEGVKLYPVRIRYAFPSELDLMARLAGLRLRERWASWRRDPFTSESESHVSVYERGR